ncbi:MAG: hypothetical protein LC725_10440 [Lentisphaerae bacterium]|nr:hypothetical protein [Lentisphaerota bacterium]
MSAPSENSKLSEGSRTRTVAMALAKWAAPAPAMGSAVYRLTQGPREHKHTYHLFCPWSPDSESLLLARYDRVAPAAEICMMQCATGEISVIGHSRKWESHSMAFQQWQGNTGRVFYLDADDAGPIGVTCASDGSAAKIVRLDDMTSVFCGPEGRYLYGATAHAAMFPDDVIAPRHDKGVLRLDVETGERRVILSIADAMRIAPEVPEQCHMYAKMIIVHRRLPRLMFNFTNTFWDQGLHEPRLRLLLTVGTDGEEPRYVGPCVHHPNWHPLENRALALHRRRRPGRRADYHL